VNESNPAHLALWGHFIGDSIGHYLLRLQSEQVASQWQVWTKSQTLPFKRVTFSVYATQANILLQVHSAKLYPNPEHFRQELIEKLRKESSKTLLSRAIHNDTPFDFVDLEPAVRLGPLATTFSKHEDMLNWLLPVVQIGTNNQIAVTGALLYSSICWHISKGQELSEIFENLKQWTQYSAFESSTWWAYQQAFEIYSQYDEQELLLFVSSFLDSSVLSQPSAQTSISILPILLHQAIHETEFNLGSILQWGGDLELLAGMKGCIAGLKHNIPDWLQNHYQNNKVLSVFPIRPPSEKEDSQLRLF
jgi:hypothetical protein